MWAYIVIGLLVFLTALLFFVLYCCSSVSRQRASSTSGKPLVAKHHTAIVALLFFFYFAYVGAEVAYGSFIFTFTKDYVPLKEAEAAGIDPVRLDTSLQLLPCLHPGPV